jgi:transposase
MAQRAHAGIDVSAHRLDVALALPGGAVREGRFANTAAGHRQLLKWLSKGGRSVQVCLEATGLYSLDVALALHRHRRTEVMVANPKAIKHYAQAHMQRGKTDPLDAQLLCDYSQRMRFVPWVPPSPQLLELQAITRRIHQLKKAITQERNRLHAEGYRAGGMALIEGDIEAHIDHLQERIEALEAQGVALIGSIGALRVPYERLRSIPGIASASALRLLGELALLPSDMKPSQWVAHAGLDPRPYQSGTSVHRATRITKAGNAYLRAALFMPALVAIRHSPHVRAFRDKLVAAGKKPLQAVVAVMRKLLHAIWGVWHHDQAFDGQRFYRIAA